MTDFNAKLMQACSDGLVNGYMKDRISFVSDGGMTDYIYDDLLDDAQFASDVGVNNDRDYAVYFNTKRLVNDLAKDTFGINLKEHDRKDLCHYIMSHKDEYKLDNLVDYRILMHKWLCNKISKKAYPNIQGMDTKEPSRDIDKWVSTLKGMYKLIKNNKIERDQALKQLTIGWDPDEQFQFSNWVRYYESGTTEKYNVKTATIKEALDFQLPSSWKRDNDVDMSTYKKPEPTERELELERAKQYRIKMHSRLRSLRRLLERYSEILPKHNLDSLRDEIHALDKSIGKLNVFAIMQDCTIRSANRIKKFGFNEGAEFLYKIAEEPLPGPMPEGNVPNVGHGMKEVISKLEDISQALKSRNLIRDLASVDIALNDLGVAAYFPELSFAQSKLIESFGYASNKVEDIIAKLRGTEGKKQEEDKLTMPAPEMPAPEAPVGPVAPLPMPKGPISKAPEPKLDAGEILTKPIGKVEEKLPTR